MANRELSPSSAKLRLLKSAVLLLPLMSCAAIAADKPSQEYKPFRLSVAQISTQSAEVANGNTELQRDSLLLSAGMNVPLNQQWSLGFRVGYDRLDYDWRNITLTGANNVAPLFGTDGQNWDHINRYRAGVSLNYRMDKHWTSF